MEIRAAGVYAAVREAIRIGYRHIDCDPLYGNEAEIGGALRDAVRDGDVTRKDLWITSKLWGSDKDARTSSPGSKRRSTTLASRTSTSTRSTGPSR